MTWVGDMPPSLEDKIGTLNRFLADGVNKASDLHDIFRLYESLPRAKAGFLFSIVRRLMTVSLEQEPARETRQRFMEICPQLPPGKQLIQQLRDWVTWSYTGVDFRSSRFKNVALDNKRFMMHFSKAMALLVEEQDLLSSVVS